MVVVRTVRALAGAPDLELVQLVGELNQQVAERYTHHWNAQTRAWGEELRLLRRAASHLDKQGYGDALVVIEYEIPRRLRRPDVIIVTERALIVLEFKVGATTHDAAARWQAASYALDLRDFHSESSSLGMAGVVVSTRAPSAGLLPLYEQGVPVFLSNENGLEDAVTSAIRRAEALGDSNSFGSNVQWLNGKYKPTPNIIEAAEMLYQGHGVVEINHAYAENLTETTTALVEHVAAASESSARVICFVTGVPGAGKTLTGLDAVHDPRLRGDGRPAGVFLSGNGPLVKVIQEALSRSAQHETRKEARRTVTTFVQNVHRFVQEYAKDANLLPPERVVVFDEAQRAWSRSKMEKENRGAFSEAEQMLEIMERFPEWAVIVALVGGGQEIHDGEAGLAAWGAALAGPNRKPWRVFASPEALQGGSSVSGHRLFGEAPSTNLQVVADSRLHLSVSVRAPRAQFLSAWVDALLRSEPENARVACGAIREFPVVMTRDLRVAKAWLRARTADGQRGGLVASAGARRLRAYGVQLSTRSGQNSDIDQWFLAPPTDVRSSNHLEVAATEFECQGLELDYVGLCWGDDLTRGETGGWTFRKFRGTSWNAVRNAQEQEYMLNKYRVLLTRARKGLLIWVPGGNFDDATRDPVPLDRTFEYLLACGVRPLVASVSEGHGALGPSVSFAELLADTRE